MKVSLLLLPLASSSLAFVVPEDLKAFSPRVQEIFRDALHAAPSVSDVSESGERTFASVVYKVNCASELLGQKTKNALDEALGSAENLRDTATNKIQDAYFDAKDWLGTAAENSQAQFEEFDASDIDVDRPHHPDHGHHGKSDRTVYQLISESKYTTKLAKLINEYPDLVKALNGTAANYTVFAPTDHAFEKIPDHDHKPSKELIETVLKYHVSDEYYPAAKVLVTKTVPTLLNSSALGDRPQRLVTNIGLRGLTVNFYSRIVAVNIFGSNGVIHGVDSILLPPPKALDIINLLPTEFSTLNLALDKTGFGEDINTTCHNGGTLFAPSNSAFERLGLKANAFLFSPYGLKYLKALLKYHVVANQTLYSDAFYSEDDANTAKWRIPSGHYHVDLPTLLKDRSLSIDIARWGRLIEITINAYERVSLSNIVARDGVIHIPSTVLIPPKKLSSGGIEQWDGKTELSESELIERLEPYTHREDL